MKVLNYGSLNIDYVYEVEHFVNKGETLLSKSMCRYGGGKGLNQSIALKRAGLDVYHAGMIGKDGVFLKNILKKENINIDLIKENKNISTGNAIIQNDIFGDNSIILYGGANQSITKQDIDETLKYFEKDDYIVLQNEINEIPYIVEKAHKKGMKILFNPAPVNESLFKINFEYINFLILNEVEASFFIKEPKVNIENLKKLISLFPKAEIVVTLGEQGSVFLTKDTVIEQKSYKVVVNDTTGAGDTFIGYFLAKKINGVEIKEVLKTASKASAISVTRKGASSSIPTIDEVENFNSK